MCVGVWLVALTVTRCARVCCRDAASLRYAIMSAMAALLAGDFDDDDDDDDESFEEGNDMNDDDADDDADEDGDDPVKLVASRLPLHASRARARWTT